jgi:hypothetical protein
MGPSGILVTADNHLWAADAHGTVKVFDLNGATPPFSTLTPIHTILDGASCRADEVGYDPRHHVVMVGNPGESTPFATFISADNYSVLGNIYFPGADGLEQPLWDSELGRFLVPVPVGDAGYVAVIKVDTNTNTFTVEKKYDINCNGTGLALGPFQHLLVGCGGGKPLLVLNALNGHLINTITQIHGSDEVWFNPGDGRFYAASSTAPTPALGVVDAETSTFLQTIPSGPGAHSVAAFAETNHVFVPIGLPSATVPADVCSTRFGLQPNTGCIFVYSHEGE